MNGGPAITSSFPPPNAAVGGGGEGQSEVEVNSMRIAAAAERLAMYAHSNELLMAHEQQFKRLCIVLARGIDYGVAKNEVPGHASILPQYLKQVQVCFQKKDSLQAAIMVLMISVKNACKMGWFSPKDAEELLTLASEVGSTFGTVNELTNEPMDFMPAVSTVMSRFYPQLKLGHVIASLEVKPGYETYVVDFHISKKMTHSQGDNIRLFVAMKDHLDTSLCIINPQRVSFLVNGRGVTCRTNIFMDQGPQLPTVVNSFLKYGTNLLQAVGQSNGHYVILVAFMSIIPASSLPMPQDYVKHDAASLNSDSEVIEESSRVSLNCPISFLRIRTPVKGYLCKHYQCFDLNNYLEVNLKQRPSWKCPHCCQPVCFTDLRVDQNMVKILKEVGENISEVIISVDGSWTTASSNKLKDKLQAKISANHQEGNQPPDPAVNSHPSDNFCTIYDLTEDDNEMDTTDNCEIQPDEKPVVSRNTQENPVSKSASLPLITRCTTESNLLNNLQNPVSKSPSLPPATRCTNEPNPYSSVQVNSGVSGALNGNSGVSSSPMNQQPANFQGTNNNYHRKNAYVIGQVASSCGQSVSVIGNEVNRARLIPRNVTRIPSATLALPVHMPTPGLKQNFKPGVTPTGNGPLLPPRAPHVSHPVGGNFERQRQLQQSCGRNGNNVVPVMSASQQNHSTSQVTTGHPTGNHSNMNFRMPQALSQAPHLSSRSFQIPRHETHPHNQAGVSLHDTVRMMNAPPPPQTGQFHHTHLVPQQAPQQQHQHQHQQQMMTMRQPPGSSFGSNSTTPQPVSRAENSIDLDANWRPAARMRGALTGQAYSTALSQLIGPNPSHNPRPTIPSSSPSSLPSSFPHNVLMTNRMNALAQQQQNQLFMATTTQPQQNHGFMANNTMNVPGSGTNQPQNQFAIPHNQPFMAHNNATNQIFMPNGTPQPQHNQAFMANNNVGSATGSFATQPQDQFCWGVN